jgi:anti-anti-sigma regulatory factor
LVDLHAVGALQRVLSQVSLPWTLDWSRVESIDVKAAHGLLGVFTLWGNQPVTLRFCGTNTLCDLLKNLTPSGRRDVEQLWWELRMALLRVMNMPHEFERVALDFCVTYEVSPPDWEAPVCRFQALSDSDAAGTLEHSPASRVGEWGGPGSPPDPNSLGLVQLSGEILGDPEGTLTALDRRLEGSDVLIISCRNLIRVDFSAAGALLNWVSGHHSQGRQVQFVDAHRLVSAFFQVIGITEHARVVLRND